MFSAGCWLYKELPACTERPFNSTINPSEPLKSWIVGLASSPEMAGIIDSVPVFYLGGKVRGFVVQGDFRYGIGRPAGFFRSPFSKKLTDFPFLPIKSVYRYPATNKASITVDCS